MKNPNFIFLLARAHFRARCTRRQIRQKVHFQQGFQSMEAMFKAKKRGKKLVEGGKKLLDFSEQHHTFNLHQESLSYLENS